MTSTRNDKMTVRKAAQARRQVTHNVEKQARANLRLLKWLREQNDHQVVAGYLAIGAEVNPMEAMEHLSVHSQHKICVPVVHQIQAPLKFREWSRDCLVEKGHLNIKVPTFGEWLLPTIMIVPSLAFDRSGTRLGYGGGYYDRTLQKLRKTGKVKAIGFAFAAQEMKSLPFDTFDQKLDSVITENEMIIFNANSEIQK